MPTQWTLSSGCRPIDYVLQGGFKSQKVYEIFGHSEQGKANLLHQLICRFFIANKGEIPFTAIYMDVNNDFNMRLITQICEFNDVNVHDVTRNIMVTDLDNFKNVETFLLRLDGIIVKYKVRLIMFDLLDFLEVYDGVRDYWEGSPRNKKNLINIEQLLGFFRRLAQTYNLLVIFTSSMCWNTRSMGIHSVDESYIIEDYPPIRIRLTNNMFDYFGTDIYKMYYLKEHGFLFIEKESPLPPPLSKKLAKVSKFGLAAVNQKEYQKFRREYETDRSNMDLRFIKFDAAFDGDEANQNSLGEIYAFEQPNLGFVFPDIAGSMGQLIKFMELEMESTLFPVKTLLDWAKDLSRGRKSCPESHLNNSYQYRCRARNIARALYPSLIAHPLERKILLNFIICMAIDRLRQNMGIPSINYGKSGMLKTKRNQIINYLKDNSKSNSIFWVKIINRFHNGLSNNLLKAFLKKLKYVPPNWNKIRVFVHSYLKKCKVIEDLKREKETEFIRFGIIPGCSFKKILLVLASGVTYDGFLDYINGNIWKLNKLILKLQRTNHKYHIFPDHLLSSEFSKWFFKILLNKKDNLKSINSLKKLKSISLQDRLLLALAGINFDSLRFFSGRPSTLHSLLSRTNKALKVKDSPIRRDDLIRWICLAREPVTERERGRINQLFRIKLIGNRYAKLFFLIGMSPRSLIRYDHDLVPLHDKLVFFNREFRIIKRPPTIEVLRKIINNTEMNEVKSIENIYSS